MFMRKFFVFYKWLMLYLAVSAFPLGVISAYNGEWMHVLLQTVILFVSSVYYQQTKEDLG